MRDALTQYVDLLFAGAPDSEEIRQEILQNTLDRYDDLIAQGKRPESAYRLAICSIGDINEILGRSPSDGTFDSTHTGAPVNHQQPEEEANPLWKRVIWGVAIGLFILCPIPVIILSTMGMETCGLCGTLAIAAVATFLLLLGSKPGKREPSGQKDSQRPYSPEDELRKSIGNLIPTVGIVAYFIVSFATGAWYITWVIFPMIAAAKRLANACFDLAKER